jgi:hypothetical protein
LALAGVKGVRIESGFATDKDLFAMKQALMSAVLLSGLALVSTASASRGKDVFVPGQPLQQQIARI